MTFRELVSGDLMIVPTRRLSTTRQPVIPRNTVMRVNKRRCGTRKSRCFYLLTIIAIGPADEIRASPGAKVESIITLSDGDDDDDPQNRSFSFSFCQCRSIKCTCPWKARMPFCGVGVSRSNRDFFLSQLNTDLLPNR